MATASYDLHALIEEARRRARQRRLASAAVLALLATAGIWGALMLTAGGRTSAPAPEAPPGYHLVRARGNVQHLLAAQGFNGSPAQRVELWFDPKSDLLRARGRGPDGRVADDASRCPACASPSAFSFGVSSFFVRYWPVDTTKFFRRPGTGTFRGRRVIWLGVLQNSFAPSDRNGQWIALDPRTHDAVAWRYYDSTATPAGQLLGESWVVRRFPDVAANRFWFALKDRFDATFLRFQPVPLSIPGREPPALRHARAVVIGRLAGATIFAAPRSDGSWRMFSVGKNGAIGGALQVENPRNLRVGVLQRGHGGLFTSKAYLVVAGSALARPGTRLLLVYADGSRSPIAPILARRPAHGGFYYYRVPTMHARARRATGLEVVRGSRVLARSDWLLSYQAPKQPGPRALRTALRLLGR